MSTIADKASHVLSGEQDPEIPAASANVLATNARNGVSDLCGFINRQVSRRAEQLGLSAEDVAGDAAFSAVVGQLLDTMASDTPRYSDEEMQCRADSSYAKIKAQAARDLGQLMVKLRDIEQRTATDRARLALSCEDLEVRRAAVRIQLEKALAGGGHESQREMADKAGVDLQKLYGGDA